MKKIAVVTIYDTNNYGNRLQNYAVGKTLENMGYKVETLVPVQREAEKSFKKYIANILAYFFPHFFSKLNSNFVRRINFIKFNKSHIKTRFIITDDGIFSDKIANKYDYFVVGSDQVWNPHFGNYENNYNNMFLNFVPREKKACFSPSIGVELVPLEWVERYKEGLSSFNYLSIRESSGAKIIKSLTGMDCEVLIDPTMMLDDNEWLKVSKNTKKIREPYVLEYFLGDRDDQKLEEISSSRNLSRITLMDKSNPTLYTYGPGEFVNLVSKAELICTDSFHACVFAILFDKPFIILKRQGNTVDMYSRIDTLLNLFGANIAGEVIHIDKSVRDKVLKEERSKVYKFLERSFQ